MARQTLLWLVLAGLMLAAVVPAGAYPLPASLILNNKNGGGAAAVAAVPAENIFLSKNPLFELGGKQIDKVPGRTLKSAANELTVAWVTPPLTERRLADGSSELRLAGYADTQTPGQPRLPQDALLVALPPGAQPKLELVQEEIGLVTAPAQLTTVDGRVVVTGTAGEQVYDLVQPAEPPGASVTLEEIGVMRGVRLARLSFFPVRIVGNQLAVVQRLQVVVNYHRPPDAPPGSPVEAAFQSVLAGMVANPDQLIASPAVPASSLTLVNRSGHAAIEVSAPGLTTISYEALTLAGFLVGTVDPHLLHLERAGAEILMDWSGDDDALFEAGEALLFYAEPRFSRWTARDVYFLSLTTSPRAAMPVRSLAPAGLPLGRLWLDSVFEQNLLYSPDCYCGMLPAGRDGDRWMWDALRQPDRTHADYALNLATLDVSQPAQLSLWLLGYTAVPGKNHQVQVSLNGTILGTIQFSGRQPNPANQVTLAVPAGLLTAGGNTLSLTLLDTGALVDGVWLDAFAVHYARDASAPNGQLLAQGNANAARYPLPLTSTTGLRAYDVTAPDQPVQLNGAALDGAHAQLSDPTSGLPRRYALVPAGSWNTPDLVRLVVPLSGAGAANEVILTPPDFAADVAALASLRRSQGLQVVVEDVRAIYDALDGRPLPEAIHAYLSDAYAHWSPRPTYALLVGDGTNDPRRYRLTTSTTFIPPWLVQADPVIGEVAADNRYALVDGNDLLPDLWIGRLPVNSHVEAAITVTKIVEYEKNPAPGNWSQSLLMVSDKNDPAVGNFTTETRALAANFGSERYNLKQLEYQDTVSQPVFHQSLLASWNQGNGLLLYNGHGSIHQWGADALLHLNDLPGLTNGNRLPVLLEMTCLTGSFQVPDLPTLDETLLRRSGRGAVATFGATGMGLSAGHMLLADGFLTRVLADRQASLGAAAAQGKLNVTLTAPALVYLLDTFTILGDPALKLNYRYAFYLPALKLRTP